MPNCMSKKAVFFLLPLSAILFLFSLIYVTLINNQLHDNPYYKEQGTHYNDLTIITQIKNWSKINSQNTKELFTKKKITENFVSQADNLGIILVPFNTHNKSVDDRIIFRLKETGTKAWLYQGIYAANQIQNNIPFPFGFPIIKQSKNKFYIFEIESTSGRQGNSLSLSKGYNYFFAQYKFSKADLIKNPQVLFQFIFIKTIFQLPLLRIQEILTIFFYASLPFIIYLMYFFKKQIIVYIFGDNLNSSLHTVQQKMHIFLLIVKRFSIRSTLDRKEKIRLCALIVSVGFYSSVGYHYFQGSYLHNKFPLNSFLPGGFFFDFFAVYDRWLRFHFNGVGLTYFPGSFLSVDIIKELFTTNIYYAAYAYVTGFVIFIFFLTYFYIKTDNKLESIQHTFIIALMTYPFLFAFQTANFEITTFISVALFFIFYTKNRFLSIMALSYAISMKIFPGIFLGLLLFEKRYKDIFVSLVLIIFFTLLPLCIYDGGFNKGVGMYLSNLQQNQQSYINFMVIDGVGNYFGHSLLNGIRTLWPGLISTEIMQTIMLPYTIITFIIFLAIIVYLIYIEKIFWKKIACLVMAMNLLPFSSNDYKLLYIYIPLFFFINYSKKEKLDIMYIILFSLLLISKNYLYFNNNPYSTLNVVFNPLLMLLILFVIIISGISKSVKEKMGQGL